MNLDELSESERSLLDAFARGGWLDLRTGDAKVDDPANAGSWDETRTIRADVIRALLLGAVAETGRSAAIRLRGARITGRLDLMGTTVDHPLSCEWCSFERELRLVEATTKTFRVVNSRLPSFNATRLRLDGILNFYRSAVGDGIRLDRARIEGDVSLRAATVGGNASGVALSADGLTVDGSLELNEGFMADGAVILRGLRITGSADLADATMTGDGSVALNVDNAHVEGRFRADRLHATGEVRLKHARITASLGLNGARLDNATGVALSGGGVIVGGGVWCLGGFTANGEVRLIGAQLAANLSMTGAILHNDHGAALNLDRASVGAIDAAGLNVTGGGITLVSTTVAAGLVLNGAHLDAGPNAEHCLLIESSTFGSDVACVAMTTQGGVRLADTQVTRHLNLKDAVLDRPGGLALDARGLRAGELSLLPGQDIEGAVSLEYAHVGLLRDDPASWPRPLRTNGLTYDVLEPQLPARDRLRWLGGNTGEYQPQPYEQLAAFYLGTGQPAVAQSVLYAKERRQRRDQVLLGRVWSLLQDVTVGYGYRPWRAATWLLALLTVGSVLYSASSPPPLKQGEAPHFNAVVYTLDLLLPIVDLGQQAAFNPAGGAQWFSYFLVAAGWILATTIAAGAARVLGR